MARLYQNYLGGRLDVAVDGMETTLSSPAFAALREVGAGDEMVITLDPDGLGGAPETVLVVDHLFGSSTVTVVRGHDTEDGGSVGRPHPVGTDWVHGPVASDLRSVGTGGGAFSLPLTRTWSANRLDGIFSAMHAAAGMNPALIHPSAPVRGYTASQSTNLTANHVAWRATDWSNVENSGPGFGESHTGNFANSWWQANFQDLRLELTHIGILARGSGGLNPRNFKVQESADGVAWTDLLTVTNEGPTNGNWWSSAITGATPSRYIRILQTGGNSGSSDNGSNPTNHLVLGEVEMWGTLSEP